MKNALRRHGRLFAALLLVLGAAGIWTVAATHEASLTESDLQARIDNALPREIALKGAAQALLQSISVESARIQLRPGKASFAFGIEGRLRNGKRVDIEATALGVPKYEDGALFFAPETINVGRLAFQGESASDLAGHFAGKLGNDSLRAVVEEKARKADDWAQKSVEAALRRYLDERPVYRLKDDAKGAVVKAALEKIAIEDGRLNVTFSLWRLTGAAIGGMVSLILGLIVAALVIRMILIGEDIDISTS